MVILRNGRRTCCCLFCVQKMSIHRLCLRANKSLCCNCTYKTTNRWHSVDAHSHNGAVSLLLSSLPIEAANGLDMPKSDKIAVWLPDLQNHKSLMLRWRSLSGYVREHVAVVFPSKGSQCLRDGCLQPIGTEIIHGVKLKIIDVPSTLILRMGQWPCCYLFCLYKMPIHRSWIRATDS